MHIGLVIYGSLDTLSGGYLYDRILVEHLRQAGDTVEIITLPWHGYARSLVDNFSADLYHRLKNGNYDRLLQDELNHPSLFRINRRLRGAVNYPIFSIVHHLRSSEARPAWQNRMYGWVERRYLNGVNGFIFNSRTTRQAVHRIGRNLEERPAVVAFPAGDRFQVQLEAGEIERRALRPGPLEVVFLGNLIPRKGLLMLLAALAEMPPDAGRLTVVGDLQADRVYTAKVKRRIEQAGLSSRVRICGRLAEAELGEILRSSHVLVVPSSYEGFGIVYLEGMAFGLPAIATTTGAAGEIITAGQNGFLVGPRDHQALAQRLIELNADRRRLAEMGLAARLSYQAHPTWGETTTKIRSFLLK